METSKRRIWDADDCALVLIDYQAEMFSNVRSSDPEVIELNVRTLIRGARAFGIPVILSTVGVKMGVNDPTIDTIRAELPGVTEIDRSSMNAWEDPSFKRAIEKTGRKRIVICGLWTEICLVFPAIEALAEGYEVTFVADAVGGQSLVEHGTAIQRLIQAGAVPNTTCATVAEWFRDWGSERADKGREVLVTYWRERAHLAKVIAARE